MKAKTELPAPPSDWRMFAGFAGCIIFLFLEFRAALSVSNQHMEDRRLRLYRGVNDINQGIFDGSDTQYRKFHLNMTPLVTYFIFLIVTKKIWEIISGINKLKQTASDVVLEGSTRYNPFFNSSSQPKIVFRYSIFYAIHGIGFISYLHHFTVVYLLGILVVFYLISLLNESKLNPICTWLFALVILFSCDYFNGYRLFELVFGSEHWIAIMMDKYRGTLQWHIYFRMAMLRVISFNMDKYWSCNNTKVYDSTNEYTNRVVQHIPSEYFGILEFFSFVLYPPLYIAGPIMTFNCFITQLASPIQSNTMANKLHSAFWTISLMLIMDIMLHYTCLHAVSISYIWEDWNEPWQVGLVGLWTLQFMFFKFLIFWRFFRTFTLFDDIVAPENMLRCMHNSNTFADFWRAWHSSFNKWTVRYLYVPLGGSKTQKYSIWLIFIFIGLWHDLWWSWVAWALMNCLFFTIELIIAGEWKRSKYNWIREIPGWEMVSLMITGMNGIFILCSNLSLVYGFDHMPTFVRLVFFSPGSWKVYLFVLLCTFSWCPIQRETRKREGTCPFAQTQPSKLAVQ